MNRDPAARDRAIVMNMAHTLALLKSPLGDSDLDRWEARADLLDAGYGAPAIDRLLDRARDAVGRV